MMKNDEISPRIKIACPSCRRNIVAEQIGDTILLGGQRGNGCHTRTAAVRLFECGACHHVWAPPQQPPPPGVSIAQGQQAEPTHKHKPGKLGNTVRARSLISAGTLWNVILTLH